MKRCPECRRDYYDDTLLYCLEDGTALVQGSVPSPDEPPTAILQGVAAQGDPTRAQINTTDATAIFPLGTEAKPQENVGDSSEKPSFSARRTAKPLAALVVAVLVLVGGFFGYRYFSASGSKQINSIAVMPFENRNSDADTDYLSDGLAESVIFRLTQIPDLRVSPTSSVMRYKGASTDIAKIASELGVDAVMTGRLTKRGDNLNITVELVDARTNKSLWGEQYERKLSELLTTQREIVAEIVSKLQLKLSGESEQKLAKKYTDNPEAYRLYLEGRYHYNKFTDDGYRKGIEYFTQVASVDPNYALAYTGLADCYFGLSDQFEPPNEVMPKARAAAEKALALDDRLAEAHASLGLVKLFYDLKWSEAEGEFRRAIELDPDYANGYLFYCRLLVSAGRYSEAVKACELAVKAEPLSPVINAYLGNVLVFADRGDEAVAQLKRALELNDGYAVSHYYLGTVYQKLGQFDRAISGFEKALQLNRNARYMMALGNAYAAAGRREDALRVLSDLNQMKKERYVSSYFLAVVNAGLNNKEEAFALLNKAFEERADSLVGIKVTVFMDNLRNDPRYSEMLKRAGMPE